MKNKLLLFCFLLISISLFSQPQVQLVKVSVTPNSADWNYKTGAKANFDISVTMNSIPMKNVEVRYELSYDMMSPFKTEKTVLKDGKLTVEGGSMKTPGFLRCRVFALYNGKEYGGLATAGFEPENIKPTAVVPDDFIQFWDKAKAENAKIPMNAEMRLLPEKCTSKSNVYELSFQNYIVGARIYGILCVPKAPGKYPALLRVPGAGVRPYNGNTSISDNGVISLEIGIHGIPVTLDQRVYDDLRLGALYDYKFFNWDNRDNVYYKRVYLGCVRAVDYIFSMNEFDGENIVVQGGSQGGALSIVTAALDNRIKGLVAFYPALCDLAGYYNGRAGGWPHLFKNSSEDACVLKQKIKTTGYYDVVNFARIVKCPGFYSFGYNDMVCPPTSMFSAYNVISAPKDILLVPETQHYAYSEQWNTASEWFSKLFDKKVTNIEKL